MDLLFRDFVLPISSPENQRRLFQLKVAPRERLEGFPLLHVDFYKDDPDVPNWRSWTAAHHMRRSDPDRGIRFQRIQPALDAVVANSGVALCGVALLAERIQRAELAFPFPIETGRWTSRAFHARFRSDALARPQVKRFRQWLLSEAATTRRWLAEFAEGGKKKHRLKSARQRKPNKVAPARKAL